MTTNEEILKSVKRGKPPANCAVLGTWALQSYVRERLSDGQRHNQFGESPVGYTGTDFETGIYRIRTIKPGQVAGRRGRKTMAPHVNFWIASRGINIGLATRMYFGDETASNDQDPVLNIIEQPERRKTLIATRSEREGATIYTFDIYLQGERETVFFDV